MSTRSRIAMKTADGIRSVYCHNDGSPRHLGATLAAHYATTERVAELLALGDLSSVGPCVSPNPGELHTFDSPAYGVTVAYHRDRAEPFLGWAVARSLDQLGRQADATDADFVYLFKDGRWLFAAMGYKLGPFKPLADYLAARGVAA